MNWGGVACYCVALSPTAGANARRPTLIGLSYLPLYDGYGADLRGPTFGRGLPRLLTWRTVHGFLAEPRMRSGSGGPVSGGPRLSANPAALPGQ
jgi:hypothetical protein